MRNLLNLKHPIVLFGAITWLVRIVSLLLFYFTDKSMQEPFISSIYAGLFHTLFIALIIFGLMLLWIHFRRFKTIIYTLSAVIFLLTVIISNVDLVLLRLTGNKFTPGVLSFYGLKYVLYSDVINPFLSNPFSFIVIIISTLAIIIIFIAIIRRVSRVELPMQLSKSFYWVTFLILISTITVVESKSQLYLYELRPPEIVFVKSLLGVEEYIPGDVETEKAKALIIAHLEKDSKEFSNPNFPLLRKIERTQYSISKENDELPDIFLIAIESLRGIELAFTNSSPNPAKTPSIDSLAKNSIVFPRFISNGWPSEEGFFCTLTSGIPHRLKHISVSYKDVNFDCLPLRLESVGYETKSIWGTIPADRVLNWSHQWFKETLYPKSTVWHDSDVVFYGKAIEAIKRHDENDAGEPLFVYLQNGDTHMPFDPASGYFESEEQKMEAEKYSFDIDKYSREQYRKTLEWTDKQLGKLLHYLSRREKESIIVLLGDHSILTDESFGPGVKVAPSNAYVHTGALIAGSMFDELPIVKDFPASQVDIMPTILSLIGYDKPMATWGQNLLSDMPESERTSIAVRPGVFRMDKGRSSLYLNANNPSNYWYNDFYDLSYEKKLSAKDDFTEKERNDLYSMMYYWSYLLENDLILPKSGDN